MHKEYHHSNMIQLNLFHKINADVEGWWSGDSDGPTVITMLCNMKFKLNIVI